MRQVCEEAALILSDEKISVEIIDPRTLVPLDEKTILNSAGVIVVDEGHQNFGVTANSFSHF